MNRKISDDTFWISECYEDNGRHVHISIYLIKHNGVNIVVDTGTNIHREEIQAELDELTDGNGPDVILLSHNDLHHVGNVNKLRKWQKVIEVRLPYSGTTNYFPEDFGIGHAEQYNSGEAVDIAGKEIIPIEPLLADRAAVSWTIDTESNVLFSSDGFGNYHQPSECEKTSEDGLPTPDQIQEYHEDTFQWLKLIDRNELMECFTEIVDDHDVSTIAPAHGNPIMEDQLSDYMGELSAVVDEIGDLYDPDSYFTNGRVSVE